MLLFWTGRHRESRDEGAALLRSLTQEYWILFSVRRLQSKLTCPCGSHFIGTLVTFLIACPHICYVSSLFGHSGLLETPDSWLFVDCLFAQICLDLWLKDKIRVRIWKSLTFSFYNSTFDIHLWKSHAKLDLDIYHLIWINYTVHHAGPTCWWP